jgi:sugar phosphate isomerase/epimerase
MCRVRADCATGSRSRGSDARAEGPLPLGSGSVDFVEAFAGLEEIGYDGTITFESFSSAVVAPVATT